MAAGCGQPDAMTDDMSETPTPVDGNPNTSPVSILMVDDNAGKRLALKAILAPLGYSIVEADSGVAALRCVSASDFAVILLDVRMPMMNGVETAAMIRQRRQSEVTPIIFITAHADDEVIDSDRYAQGAVDFIVAPVAPEELRAKVSVFANLFLRAQDIAAKASAVQASADQLRLLTEAAPVGIFQTDADNRYVYTNPRWSEITGVSAADAAGQPFETVVRPDQRGELTDVLAGDITQASEICHRFELRRGDESVRVVLVTSRSVPDSGGGLAGRIGTLADVTAEAGAEAAMSDARDEATEASRMKSDFLANMSHEIRTPMNGVIGMTDLLLETTLDDRQRDYALTVRNSGEALLAIINDILDFSKVEAGKLDIEDVDFSVRTIVEDVADLLAGPAHAKGLDLITVVDDTVSAAVTGDPGRVRQVLTNLIGNALKFTHSGEVVVRVTESRVPDDEVDVDVIGDRSPVAAAEMAVAPNTLVRFEVADTGDGIAAEKLELIFAPFVQADTSTSRRYGGTGLGLAISRQLIDLMGGTCGVTSALGVGSTFWFTIRVRAHRGRHQYDGPSTDPELAGIKALIVSDRATQRSVLSDYLTGWGMTVTTSESGPAALGVLRTAATVGQPFDVALLDWSMPGMDGPELKNAIVVDPALTARLVLLTSFGHERDLDNANQSGVCVSVSKPVHREGLRVGLRVAMGLQKAEVTPTPVTTRAASPGESASGRVLLAEDNLINQKVVVAILTNAGYEVDSVLNGAAAVAAVAARPYDAILMDCQMPELSGYEATAAIRALNSSGRLTPIIAMTAGARPEDRQRCLAGGMDSYLSKPVSKDTLLSLVARFVRNGLAGSSWRVDAVGSDQPVIDEDLLAELRLLGERNDPDFLADVVGQFVADTEPLIAELHVALISNHTTAIARIAHSVKGSSDQLGGRRLAASCSRLETMALTGSLTEGKVSVKQLELDYQELCRALARQLWAPDRQETGGHRA
jgi:PAS domain S-box-containing protein